MQILRKSTGPRPYCRTSRADYPSPFAVLVPALSFQNPNKTPCSPLHCARLHPARCFNGIFNFGISHSETTCEIDSTTRLLKFRRLPPAPELQSSESAAIILPLNVTIPAVIVFGDSIVDTGNNNNLATIAKANYPPYGKDLMGGKPTGRFSNGKVPSDFFVEELRIKELLPAYLDPKLQTEDLTTGVNFASGGAGLDPLTSKIANVISLSEQLNLFRNYTAKLKGLIGEERTSTIVANGLFVLAAGSNDITNTYYSTPLRRLRYDVPSYTDLLVSLASNFVRDLYALGARKIGVAGIPPVGCVPAQRTIAGGPHRNCAKHYNQAAQLFNTKLQAKLSSLNRHLPQARMVYLDIYTLLLDLVRNPKNYGFTTASKGCCGTGLIEVAILCSSSSVTCKNDSEYVFWDSFHLTERAYRMVVHQVLQKQIHYFI
ncbi:Triacylglycerol lipase [Bertholletia excelsa]